MKLIKFFWLLPIFAALIPPLNAGQLETLSYSFADRSAADLEKLAAPIALYPDPLLAVMLPASAFQIEIVHAARFVASDDNRANLDDQTWKASVKAVARFPSVIQRMHDELGWTVELGQAFRQQPEELMDAIQTLRARAQSNGALQTTVGQVVITTNAVVARTHEIQIIYLTNQIIEIIPANPEVIHLPVYDPATVYAARGTRDHDPERPLITFGAGISGVAGIATNHCDWHYGSIYSGPVKEPLGGPFYPPPSSFLPPIYHPPPGSEAQKPVTTPN